MSENSVRISVRVNDDTAAGLARVRASVHGLGDGMRNDFSRIGQDAGSSMRSGITGELGGVTQEAESVGLMAGTSMTEALVGVAVAVAPAIGAALAGGIVLAFGAIPVALGAALLLGSKKHGTAIRKEWTGTLKSIKKDFTEAAQPLIPVLENARHKLEDLAKRAAPAFKQAMKAAAPALEDFTNKLAKGFAKFGKAAFKPMMDAFDSLLRTINISGVLGALGKSFNALAKAVNQNAKPIGQLLTGLLMLLPAAVYLVAGLTKLYGWCEKLAKVMYNWNPIIIVLRLVFAALWPVIKTVIRWLDPLWHWVDKLINRGSKTDGLVKFKGAISALVGPIRTVIGWIQKIISWIGKIKGKTIKLAETGADKIISIVKTAISWLSKLKSKTISIGVNIAKGAASLISKLFAHGGVVGGGGGYAHGGFVGQAAGGGPRSNLTLVGENGPELVDLAPGSHVRSNPDSTRLLGEGRHGSDKVVLEIVAGNDDVSRMLVEILKRAVRVRGGNVQTVIGS